MHCSAIVAHKIRILTFLFCLVTVTKQHAIFLTSYHIYVDVDYVIYLEPNRFLIRQMYTLKFKHGNLFWYIVIHKWRSNEVNQYRAWILDVMLIALVLKVTLLEWLSKFALCWVPRESVLRGSSTHKATRNAQNLKVKLIEWLLKLTLLEWHQVFRPHGKLVIVFEWVI